MRMGRVMTRARRGRDALVASALLCCGCATTPVEFEVVVLATGEPVPNAQFCVREDTYIARHRQEWGTTDADGRVTLAVPTESKGVHGYVTGEAGKLYQTFRFSRLDWSHRDVWTDALASRPGAYADPPLLVRLRLPVRSALD